MEESEVCVEISKNGVDASTLLYQGRTRKKKRAVVENQPANMRC